MVGVARSGQSLMMPGPEASNLTHSITQVKVNIVTNQHHRTSNDSKTLKSDDFKDTEMFHLRITKLKVKNKPIPSLIPLQLLAVH